jgi:dienelactone hydrolase
MESKKEVAMKKSILLLMMALILWSVSAHAELKTIVTEYKHGDTVLEGYLAYDDSVEGKRPGVIVVHEWWGINNYVRMRTEQLAKLGYIAFAIDMYGKGVRAKDAKEAGALSGTYTSDRQLMRSRASAGLEVLKNHSLTDPKRIAAIGYCFGGTTVLEMARGGAELAGVVSFHGGLATPNPGDAKNIKGKILVLHGADDPFVPPKQVMAFQDEMGNAGVDWQMVSYGGAVHSFTNPDSGNDPSKGAAYSEKADRRSFEAMKDFFAEILK